MGSFLGKPTNEEIKEQPKILTIEEKFDLEIEKITISFNELEEKYKAFKNSIIRKTKRASGKNTKRSTGRE